MLNLKDSGLLVCHMVYVGRYGLCIHLKD